MVRAGKRDSNQPSRGIRKSTGRTSSSANDTLFRTAVLNSAIGVAIADLHGRFITVNEAFCRLTGYTEDELHSLRWATLTHPDDREVNLALARRMYAGVLRSFLLEKRYVRKNGSTVWVRNSTSVLNCVAGKPVTFMALVEDITERKRAEQALRDLSSRLLQVQDEERRRIARDLHDVTGQNLAGLVMTLVSVKNGSAELGAKARRALEVSLDLAKQCSTDIRTLSYLLHPPMLDEFGLADALRWYVRGFRDRSGVSVTLRLSGNVRRLPVDMETTLFRVVQESLTNVRRHSGSKRAYVGIRFHPKNVYVKVRDFGHRSTARRSLGRKALLRGVGIPGMHERLQQFGGKLDVDFGKAGTVVTASLPLVGKSG